MNIIEAWKQAKEGQIIRRKSSSTQVTKHEEIGLTRNLWFHTGGDFDALADDWEIVKKKKKFVMANISFELGKDHGDIVLKRDGIIMGFQFLDKPPMTMTLEWEE